MIHRTIFPVLVVMALGLTQPLCGFTQEDTSEAVKLESGLYYTVQKGDTLWDLSEHFYDSPWIWPDFWERNQEIANPHWIYPGESVRIYTREELEAMEKKPAPAIVVPPPEPSYYHYPPIDRVGFIRQDPVSPSGTIFKVVKGDKCLISQWDQVYAQPAVGFALKPGERFTVFRTFGPLKDPGTKKVIGTQHYIVGVIEITDVEPKFTVGKVVKSYRTIEKNDLLMPYEPRSPNILLTESKEELEGRIIAAEEGETIFAEHAIAFIDKGRQDGIQVGQSYSVYYQEKGRIDPERKEDVLLMPTDFARILVLRTEETTATVLVTYSEQSIEPWAAIHAAAP